MIPWFNGTAWPLVLILIGGATEMKMAEAFLPAITWKRRCIADIFFSSCRLCLVAAHPFVQAGLGPGLGIDLLGDEGTLQAVPCVGGGQIAGNDHGPRRHAPVGDLAGGAVQDAGALAEEYAHR